MISLETMDHHEKVRALALLSLILVGVWDGACRFDCCT